MHSQRQHVIRVEMVNCDSSVWATTKPSDFELDVRNMGSRKRFSSATES